MNTSSWADVPAVSFQIEVFCGSPSGIWVPQSVVTLRSLLAWALICWIALVRVGKSLLTVAIQVSASCSVSSCPSRDSFSLRAATPTDYSACFRIASSYCIGLVWNICVSSATLWKKLQMKPSWAPADVGTNGWQLRSNVVDNIHTIGK
jgi:hypothetical protein